MSRIGMRHYSLAAGKGRCPPARSWLPRRQPRRSPGSCPSRAAGTRAAPAIPGQPVAQLAERREPGPGLARGRPPAAASSSGPDSRTRRRAAPPRSRNAATSLERHARLRVLARDVHLEQAVHRRVRAAPASWRHALSESIAWISRTRPTMSRTLRLCTWPMKSQVNRSPCRSCLASSASDAVLADQRDPALGQRRQVVGRRRTWWRPGSARPGPTRSRTAPGSRAIDGRIKHEQPHHPLPAGDAVVAAVREVPLGPADRALAGHRHLCDAGSCAARARRTATGRRCRRGRRPRRSAAQRRRPTSSPTS